MESLLNNLATIVLARSSGSGLRTLRRGSSYIPTPDTAPPPVPLEVAGRGLRAQLAEVNRYGRLLRDHMEHNNSHGDVHWNRLTITIKNHGDVIYQCPADPRNIKNIYMLFRAVCNCNLDKLNEYLVQHSDEDPVVPNVWEGITPPVAEGVVVRDS